MKIRQITLSLVHPSPMNPRKTFEEDALQELADNIESQGLLQPITVRPIPDKTRFEVVDGDGDFQTEYEIVCGERRYRAMCRLNNKYIELDKTDENGEPINPFDSIPAIVREMDDKTAFDAMITENLQRKDVDPMEEAFAFGQLIKNGSSAEDVAARFGKSVRFVQDRCKLNSLIPELMLAVKEGKCPIVAAQIIARLDESAQQRYFKINSDSYYGFTKSTAEQFVNNLFMNLSRSLWFKDEEVEFTGGCDRKCSECEFNTSNHGCLFYEMKAEDDGRCTNRARYNAKAASFILGKIDGMGDKLVNKGEPLEYGKSVIAFSESTHEDADTKALKDKIKAGLEQRGLEYVNPSEAFSHKCWYDADDGRTIEMLQKGELYRVIRLFDYNGPTFEEEFHYVKGHSAEGNTSGLPLEVQSLLGKYKSEYNGLRTKLTTTAIDTLYKCETINKEPLTEDERVMMLSIMLVNNYNLCKAIGLTDYTDVKKILGFVVTHSETWAQIMHGWIICQMHERYNCLLMGETLLPDLGKLHCPEEYEAAQQKVKDKFEKFKEKTTKRLAELGYGLDGQPLVIKEEETGTDHLKKKREFKKKHPDALVLFKNGDFYELYEEDAEVGAEILGLNLSWIPDKPEIKMCGFVCPAIDKYLPKLIKAGKRVAICEELDDSKK